MEFVRGLHNIKPHHRGCILTIGNFDGFHRGHQSLVAVLKEKGYKYKLPVIVMIFEPQPREYLSSIMTSRLTRLRDKINYLCDAGIDIILCVSFNKKFASIKAYNFVKKILISKLGIRCICVGNDFRFGAFMQGDFFFLKKISERSGFGFKVIPVSTCLDRDGNKISSTAIRIALKKNKILEAESLLGHSYCVSGRVIRGDELGRIIGFPTANIYLQGKKLPIHGVYAVKVYGISDVPFSGIANVGFRPTISGTFEQKLEVHLLNISVNLYTYYITVVFLAKVRNERFFSSLKTLKNQIRSDVRRVYNYFNRKLI